MPSFQSRSSSARPIIAMISPVLYGALKQAKTWARKAAIKSFDVVSGANRISRNPGRMRRISLRCAKSDFLGAAILVTTISKSRRRRSCKTSASSPTVSITQLCNEGASHNHDSSLVSSQMTNILGMTPSQQMSVIQIFPYAVLDYRLQTGRHVFVPGRAGQEISVFAGRQFVDRYPYPQCDSITSVVIHPEAVRQREVAGPHHFRNLDCHLRAAAAGD